MNNFKYPQGSEWRKWDLHVHTPASALNNNFKGNSIAQKWNNYFQKLESIKGVSVLGITDYFSIDGFNKVLDYKKQGNLSNFDLILLNIELRIIPVTDNDRAINLHIIFSEDVLDELEAKFFTSLEFHYQYESFKCIRSDLIKLGRKYKNNINIEEETAYRFGIEQFKTNVEDLREIFSKNKELRENSIIIVSNSSQNGCSGIQHSSLAATREDIYNFVHCIFSGNPNDREYFLGKGSDDIEEVIRKYGGLKPCIHGSDAHDLEQICKPHQKRFTWIKSDPTFEGLKQIIYEPEERVYIGEEPPIKIDRSRILKKITISNSNKWFEDCEPLEFNEGLISIIGGKGTGKTAILDLIAYATGSYKSYEEDATKSKSFLKKAFKELKSSKIKVKWDDGEIDEITIGDRMKVTNKVGKVRYLPQDFIDQLCTELGKNELEQQIENVIFQKIPAENKANFTEFGSYKNAQLKVIRNKESRITKQIEEINSKIYEHLKIIGSKNNKNDEKKKVEDEIKKLEVEMKKITDSLKDSKAQKDILEEQKISSEQKSDLEKVISELNTTTLKIEEILNEVSVFLEDSEVFIDDLKNSLKIIGIPYDNIERIKIVLYPENLDQILSNQKKDIEEKIEKQKEELEKLNNKIDELNSKINIEKSQQDKINEINVSLANLKKKKDSLNCDIKKIENSEKDLKKIFNDRENLFVNYFELIFEEKEKLKEIYSPLENFLKESGEENEKLFDFTVKFNFDFNAMADEGHELIDLRSDGKFRQTSAVVLKEELEKLGFKLDLNEERMSDIDKESTKNFIKNIKGLFIKKNRTIQSQLKERYTEHDFYNWIYATKYYSINYSIKFNGIELNNLSPGLKGVALLILFLELDKEDKRPILIDQPEENLDNRSVYCTLVRYFINAKKRRQVIIVTHNPNLVVNTDSEQVIVADFDRGLLSQKAYICYVSGSLENSFKDDSFVINLEKQGIREHVCEILEGGKIAFEKREQKYGFR